MHKSERLVCSPLLFFTIPTTGNCRPWSSNPYLQRAKSAHSVSFPDYLHLRLGKPYPLVVEVVEYGHREEEHEDLGKHMICGQNVDKRFQLFTKMSAAPFQTPAKGLRYFSYLGQDLGDAVENGGRDSRHLLQESWHLLQDSRRLLQDFDSKLHVSESHGMSQSIGDAYAETRRRDR